MAEQPTKDPGRIPAEGERATCPWCRRSVAVRLGGKLREHRPYAESEPFQTTREREARQAIPSIRGGLCPGSGNEVAPSNLGEGG